MFFLPSWNRLSSIYRVSMKGGLMILVIVLLSLSSGPAHSQGVEIIKFNTLEKIINVKSEKVQVINFWATWCAPCIKELPLLEAIHQKPALGAKITLVSLDFADKVSKVTEFVKQRNMHSEVVLLDEVDYNAWIDKVDESWSGAIPATLVINTMTGKRKFVEKELKAGELEAMIGSVR